MLFYYATGITPAMVDPKPGTGSVYAIRLRDKDGVYLDGGKTYKPTLPGPIPAKHFWSFAVYDNQTRSLLPTDQKLAVDGFPDQTRSMIQTDQRHPAVSSQEKDLIVNDDGSIDVLFGPKVPEGKEPNWVQTAPGTGWNVVLRLYGALEPFFDQTWRPGEIELVP
jgi:hypothetical protein